MSIERKTKPVGLLGCNCSIVYDTENKTAIIVDPGGDAELLIQFCEERELKIEKIVITHGHFDHVLAANAIKEKTGAVIYLHEEDRWLYENVDKQGEMFGFEIEKIGTFDETLDHQQEHCCGDITLETLHTPGHSPGSACFHLESEKILFAGDTLFAGAVGRSDIWKGSHEQLVGSIKTHLLPLDEATVVVPGHGPETTIRKEIESNPFLT